MFKDQNASASAGDNHHSGRTGCSVDWAFALIAGILCFTRFRHGLAPLQSYDDDFFYYLRAALNFVHTGRSTFDGVHLTNGYHPFWFLVVALTCKLAPARLFFVVLQCVEFGLACTTYSLLKRTFLRQTAYHPLACWSAAVVATFAAALARGGMEIGLLLPCVAAVLYYRLRPTFRWSKPQAATYGLLLSLVVLARLDAIILVAAMLAAEFTRARPRSPMQPQALVALCAGTILVPLYLVSNQWWFHTWLPVSGQAKQLLLHHAVSFRAIQSVFLNPSVTLQCLTWGAICLTAACLLRVRQGSALSSSARIACALLLFPWLHLLSLSLRSDWAVWPWYLYPFVLVYAAAAILLLPQTTRLQQNALYRWTPLLFALLLLFALGITWGSATPNRMYRENVALAAWMHQHPGVYAMGDESGMLSYMTTQPMVQVEGLMEDREFLTAIQQQRPLVQVLRRYGATYYVGGRNTPNGPCLLAVEPAQAGPKSPHMYALLCGSDGLMPQPPESQHQIYAITQVHPAFPSVENLSR